MKVWKQKIPVFPRQHLSVVSRPRPAAARVVDWQGEGQCQEQDLVSHRGSLEVLDLTG